MNKSRHSIPLSSLPPKLRAEAEKQLGGLSFSEALDLPVKIPRALQPMKEKHLIRQNRRGLNKLESAFFEYLKHAYPREDIVPHGVTLLLGNNLRYTPDFICFFEDGLTVWETKGPYFRDDAKVKLKAAATKYKRIKVYLVQKIEGRWRIEKVLP